jgi:hypothetical protein
METVRKGDVMPFQRPVKDRSGKVRIETGKKPTRADHESTDYLVEGVIGTIPK